MVLDKRVSEPQNAFVRGRQILDFLLITNECLDSHIRYSIPGVLCMLDLEKAYKHLHWNFLLNMLRGRGFDSRWRKWICEWNPKWLCSKLTS